MARGMANANVRLWLMLAALPAILSIGGGSSTVTMAQEAKQGPQFEEITKYFEGVDIADDRTKVTWAHRVNSRQALMKALNDDRLMMLEADVSMGKVNKTGSDMPVMAHALSDDIDLSLKEFLKIVNDTLAAGNKKKGIKLDFKSDLAFNKSREVIQEARLLMSKPYPLWLNADIVMGPGSTEKWNVNPDVFLNDSNFLFPSAGISVGWTTGETSSCYTPEHLTRLSTYLQKHNLNNSESVTVAIRASIAARCYDDLVKWLDANLRNATLTLWTGDKDTVAAEPLRELIKKATKSRVYVDLPEALRNQVLNTTTPPEPSSSSRIGSIAPLIVLPFTLAMCRLQ